VTAGTNADDFASLEFVAKILRPAASEIATGAPLEHLKNIIPNHPSGMYTGGGD
jgi:hypothetical protein